MSRRTRVWVSAALAALLLLASLPPSRVMAQAQNPALTASPTSG